MLSMIGSNQRQFNTDDKVWFDFDGKINGFGVVMGKGMNGLVDMYIVLPDKPIGDNKAILVPSTLMLPIAEKILENYATV